MENTLPTPEILPQNPDGMPHQAEAAIPQYRQPSPRKNSIFALILIVLIMLAIMLVSAAAKPRGGTVQNITVSGQSPTPTSIAATSTRKLSPFASESAFVQLEYNAHALPKTIQGAVLSDPTILPPLLDLPLGF